MSKKIQASINKCLGCGDDMIFNPDTKSLYCVSCKATKDISAQHGMPKHEVDAKHNLSSNKNQEWIKQNKSLQCPNCGAQVLLNSYQISTKCPYCDTSLIASHNKTTNMMPDAIIPFKFSKKRAEELFKEKLKNKFLVPKKFKQNIKADEIHSYYFPAFVFDAECQSVYSGTLYTEYTIEDKNGFKETKKKYFNINGMKQTIHSAIEIEASSKITQFELNSIRPYNFSEARIYSDEFVYGYGLECNSSSINETSNQAKTIINAEIKKQILADHTHDGVEKLNIQTNFNKFTYSHCILPIYRINYKYKDKTYSNIMNGQTGSLGGNYPKSGGKIAAIVFAILMVVGIPVLLFVLAILGIL